MYYSHTQARAKLPKKRRRVINLDLPDPPTRPAKMNSSLALYNKGQKYFLSKYQTDPDLKSDFITFNPNEIWNLSKPLINSD